VFRALSLRGGTTKQSFFVVLNLPSVILNGVKNLFRGLIKDCYAFAHGKWLAMTKRISNHKKSLTRYGLVTVVILLMISIVLFQSPKYDLRAQNYNKTWSTTDDFNTGTNSNIDTAGDQAQLATTTTAFNEGFTNTTNKDATSDANWDTVAHKLTLPGDPTNGTATDLQAKWKAAVGMSEEIKSSTYDSTNHFVYLGGSLGSFAALKTSDNTLIDLTSKLPANGTNSLWSLTFDSTNGKVYLGWWNGALGAFSGGASPSAGTFTSLTSKISAIWGGDPVRSLAFDSTNGKVYLGGLGKFGVFTGGADPANGTWITLTSKISTDWGFAYIMAMTFDSTNGKIYLGGTGRFGVFTGGVDPANGTWVYLTAKISADWSASDVGSFAFDSTNGKIYLGGGSGKFGVFTGGADPANGTWVYLTAKISADWSTNAIYSSIFDSTNGKIYLGSSSGKFGAFTGGSDPANGTWVYLTAKISADWSTNSINNLCFDPISGKVYLGGGSGKFGAFTGGADPANGTWTNLATNIAAAFVGHDIKSSAYDLTNGFLYLGGANGNFMSHKISDGTTTNLTLKISSSWSTDTIMALTLDSASGIVYLGGTNGKIGAFKGGASPGSGTFYYLRTIGTFATNWSTQTVYSLAFDSTNGFMYLGGGNGKFGAFAVNATPTNDTWIYLTTVGSFSTDWSSIDIKALVFDLADGRIFLGGYSTGKFGAFTGGASPSSGSWVNLNLKNAGFNINAFALDASSGRLYVGGWNGATNLAFFTGLADPANGTWTLLPSMLSELSINSIVFVGGKIFAGNSGTNHFGYFNCGSNPNLGSWTNLSAGINGFWSTNTVSTIVATSSTMLYLAGSTGRFASFLIGYSTNKNGISNTLDATSQNIYKATLTATALTPTNTGITYYLSNNGGSTWNAVSSGVEYTFATATSDLRWKANLTTTDAAVTPEITAIALSYKYFSSNTGTMSLVYDATQAVTPTLLTLSGTTPTNTALTTKVRTASTSGGLAAATWSDIKTLANSPINLKTINVGGITGVPDNQFTEVYATLSTTDGLSTPTLSDVTEQYVINEAPQLQTLTASQAIDGSKIVNIAYQVKDPDTHSNPYNQDQVSFSYQYSVNSGQDWLNCTTVTNSGLQAVNADGSWTSETAAWNIGTDLPNQFFNNTVKVKVLANDNEQAHNTAELASATFVLDTINPLAGAMSGGGVGIKVNDGTSWTNSASVDLAFSATDDTAKYIEVRNDANFTGTREVYATPKIGWPLSINDGNKTAHVRFYDAMGNTADASANVLLDTTAPAMPAHFTLFDTSDMQLGTYQIVVSWNQINNPSDFLTYSLERKTESTEWAELATFNNISSDVYSDKGLDNTKTYSYRLRSKDIHSNNSAYTDIKSLMPAGVDTIPPQITGDGASATAGDTIATVTWITDKPSDSYVEYGTTTDYGSIQGSDELVVNHAVNLVGLNPTTTYQFRIKSRDVSGNRAVSTNSSFTTTLPAEAAAGVSITGATAQKPGADPEEVTIIWTTDRYSTSQVYYGTSENNLDMTTTADGSLNKTHYVAIAHLNPNTKYYYKAYSKDTYGNEVWGESKYFVTAQSGLSTPTIMSVKATDLTLNSAIVSWETTTVATSVVEVGTEGGVYSKHVEDKSLGSTTKHVIRLADLESGKEYHFRVLGQGTDQRWVASDDYVFSTVSMPEISNISVKDISSTQATVTWNTNIEITSSVVYGTNSIDQSQGDAVASKEHVITLRSLLPATKYNFLIRATDSYGNTASSSVNSFQTIIDTTAPKITNMKSEVSIISDSDGNSKAQAIVSWATDEPATSLVKYSLGVSPADDYPLKTQEEVGLTTSHVVIISSLQPSATYHMRLLSKDSSANLVTSDDYSVITLNQQKTLLEYIVQILQNRFSWISNIGLFQ